MAAIEVNKVGEMSLIEGASGYGKMSSLAMW